MFYFCSPVRKILYEKNDEKLSKDRVDDRIIEDINNNDKYS